MDRQALRHASLIVLAIVAAAVAVAADLSTGRLLHSLRLVGLPLGGFAFGQAMGLAVSRLVRQAGEKPRSRHVALAAFVGCGVFLAIHYALYASIDVKSEPCVYATCIPDTPCESELCQPASYPAYLAYEARRRPADSLSAIETLEKRVRIKPVAFARRGGHRPAPWLLLEAVGFIVGSVSMALVPSRAVLTLLNRELFAAAGLSFLALVVGVPGLLGAASGPEKAIVLTAIALFGLAKLFGRPTAAGREGAPSPMAPVASAVLLAMAVLLGVFLVWRINQAMSPIASRSNTR